MPKKDDVTNCSNPKCQICHPYDPVESYGKMIDRQAERKMEAYKESKLLAADLLKMQRGY